MRRSHSWVEDSLAEARVDKHRRVLEKAELAAPPVVWDCCASVLRTKTTLSRRYLISSLPPEKFARSSQRFVTSKDEIPTDIMISEHRLQYYPRSLQKVRVARTQGHLKV
eukprot:3766505-Amphidinium_carterae.1